MRRHVPTLSAGRSIAAVLLTVGLLAATASVAGARATTAAPAASLTTLRCTSTLQPWQRSVSVTSVMGSAPGVHSLQMRFSLLEKVPGEPVQAVSDGDLGEWVAPTDPTLGQRAADVWKLVKVVVAVDAPARYRFKVQYRWLAADGHVIARTTRTSPTCTERELRPDLLVRRVTVHPVAGHPAEDRYVAVVANDGLTKTGPFSVLFAPGAGTASQTAAVGSLRPGTHAQVPFIGPACDPGAPPTVVADPTDAVDDFDRSNNTMTVTCPPVSSQADH